MKTSTPLSFVLAAIVASGLYATPWVLTWVLDLAPPDFGVETLPPPPDAVFVSLDVEGLEDELEDPQDVEGELEDDDAEIVEDPGEATESEAGTEEGDGQPGGEAVEKGGESKAVAGGGVVGKKQLQVQRRRRRRERCRAPHPHVRQAEDGVIEIDRSFVDQTTKNLRTFMKLGYSRPYREEGVKGWYISGFGCASPVFKAGFRRKDVLLTVNGKKTRTVTGVFMLYLKLKKKSDFEVELLRRGRPKTLRFRVVPG